MKYLLLAVVILCITLVQGQTNTPCTPEVGYSPCPRCVYRTQDARDECYMRIALAFGVTLNRERPYGAIIVNHVSNNISCYGVNSGNDNVLSHGEIAAFNNCTKLYPSPTGNDRTNPGINWANHTLYTSAEPCPMCAAASVWRGLGRMVYGTDIPTLARIGSKQITIRTREIYSNSILSLFKTGAQGVQGSNYVPLLKESVLKEECDRAFYTAFGYAYPPVGYKACEDVFANEYGQCGHDHGYGFNQ
ncbi:hypothetical protein PPL_08516 [Heterostelium album PN500]|uniref:CMP/dCMP-type deaminase domain-containing protein n=1 Tax=Heterostelium pallidum (strain ATCC 26659 / Pp 5 / PN500) TaxID=670386 RepID=D3BIE6_HETP5|nr:hypothetical protein PPL_08516 [Heterostelium album PN500]EFA79046.1 hypothetical protein PPL_08516 [Heterostelium album PN500]|eukprot:XP_020431169.1 hypothetical protein PPL_08516 [Heterostelium album PN500]